MGALGHGIRQVDFVRDVIGDFTDLLKEGKSVAAATKEMKSRFADPIKDADDGPLFWIALADVQWTYGALDPKVLQRVRKDLQSGRGSDRRTEDERALSRRRAAIEKFIAKIASPNPRPRKPPKVVVRAPKFAPGDCLSVRVSEDQYAAALVLAADHSRSEYGKNLIGVLDYCGASKPTMPVFQKRKWSARIHHEGGVRQDVAWYQSFGFRSAKNRIEIVGRVEIVASDPNQSDTYCGWDGIGKHVIRRRERASSIDAHTDSIRG